MGIFKNQKIFIAAEIIIFCILAFIVGSAQTISPFYGDLNLIDEGQFAAWANFMLHGKMMFRDIYITYGPLYVYPLYILFKLFTPSAFLVRIYIIFGSIIGIVILNILMLNFKITRVSRYLLNFLLILLPLIILRQAVGFIAIYFLILTESKKNNLYPFFSGLFSVITFLISPELGIIVFLIAIACYACRLLFYSNKNFHLKSFTYFAFGLLLPVIIFGFWAHREGWLSYYVQVTGQILSNFSGINAPNGKNLPNIFAVMSGKNSVLKFAKFIFSKEIFVYYILLLNIFVFLFITVKTILNVNSQIDKKIMIILLYSLAFLYLFVGRPDFPHLIFGLSPILLILIYYFDRNIALYKINIKNNFKKYLNLLTVIAIMFFITRLLYMNNPQIKNITKIISAISTFKFNPKFVGPIVVSENQKKYFEDLQEFINKNSRPTDRIFILSDEPMLYFILNRDDATKYALPYIASTKNMRKELTAELENNKPKYIFFNKRAWSVDDISNTVRLPEVMEYIKQNYSLFRIIDNVIIYKPTK